jgi:glyoxylase-like metal-dependent hydrolase (beta-lactamase superfamily II)
MRVETIVIPTPFYVGPVNVYLIREDPLTLLDTGPVMDGSLQALRDGLKQLGHQVSDIKRIIISHAHVDHFGLARDLADESGAEVFIHSWDAEAVTGDGDYSRQESLLAAAGVPSDVIDKMKSGYGEISQYARRIQKVTTLEDADEIAFDHESLVVVHTPGHTPGSICLLRKSNRLVLSADTVLKNITPNPMLNADPIDPARRFQSLGEYMVSLARLKSLAPTLVKGGHGGDVSDYDEYFHRLYRFTQARQNKLLGLIPRDGVTAWSATSLLFPDADGYHRFLALSETLGHLDFAVNEGKLAVERIEGKDVYRLP